MTTTTPPAGLTAIRGYAKRAHLFRNALLEAAGPAIAHYAGPKAETFIGPSLIWNEGPGENRVCVQLAPRWQNDLDQPGWAATLRLSTELSRAAGLKWAGSKADCFTENLGHLCVELYFGEDFITALTEASHTIAGFMAYQANAVVERDQASTVVERDQASTVIERDQAVAKAVGAVSVLCECLSAGGPYFKCPACST